MREFLSESETICIRCHPDALDWCPDDAILRLCPDHQNRQNHQNPDHPHAQSSKYQIDYHAFWDIAEPSPIVDFLTDEMARPRWDRDALCAGCDNPQRGKTGQGGQVGSLLRQVRRPGCPDPLTACAGCWYALLDRLCRVCGRRCSTGPGNPAHPDEPATCSPHCSAIWSRRKPEQENIPRAWRQTLYIGGDQVRWLHGRLELGAVTTWSKAPDPTTRSYAAPKLRVGADTETWRKLPSAFSHRASMQQETTKCPSCGRMAKVEEFDVVVLGRGRGGEKGRQEEESLRKRSVRCKCGFHTTQVQSQTK